MRGLTTGRGYQGPVKRFGIKLKPSKSEKGRRRPGSLGPWHPARVIFRVPMAGQLGMFTRVVYNNKILDYKGFKCRVNKINGTIEGKLEKDLEIILRDNDLDKYEINNKDVFKISKIEKDNITIKNDDKEIILKNNEIYKHFNIAFCRTLYAVQGNAYESYYYATEDYKFINNRSAYTLISRLTKSQISN